MRSPKIVLLVRDLDYGGTQRQVVTLARALHERGVPTSVIAFYAGGPLGAELRAHGVPTHVLDKRGRWDVVRFLGRLVRRVRREKPDVLCSFLVLENVLAAMMKPLLPRCRIAWGLRSSDMDLSRYDWLMRMMTRVESLLAPVADVVVVNSQAGRRVAVGRGFREDRLVVVPNGFDTERFQPDPSGGARVRREWGVTEGAPLVGIVARLDPMKDHDTFLRAAARLASTRPEMRFACVGDGPAATREALQERAAGLGLADRVTWSPARLDMPSVYSALTVLVSSSAFGEGLSNVLGEAMACGTPCVVTDVGDSAFAVGEEGIVTAPGDDGALAAGMTRMISARAEDEALSARVRQRIVHDFGLDQLVARTMAAMAPPP